MNTRTFDDWQPMLSERLDRAGYTTLVLVGAHASGKSTLRRQLAAAFGWRSDEELGEVLRRQRQASDASNHAQLHQPDFDAEVFEAELCRDQAASIAQQRVIETWHPGNLAYALHRSAPVVSDFYPRIEAACRLVRHQTLVIPLQISLETLKVRAHEPGPEGWEYLRFLWQVGVQAHAQALELGLTCLEPLSTDGFSPEESIRTLAASLLAHLR